MEGSRTDLSFHLVYEEDNVTKEAVIGVIELKKDIAMKDATFGFNQLLVYLTYVARVCRTRLGYAGVNGGFEGLLLWQKQASRARVFPQDAFSL
jgi:hypothetical protein